MTHSFRKYFFPLLVFLATSWLICFFQLGSVGIFDLDEGLYTTASRQMLESGDFIVPHIGSEVRFAKPPLIYWLQVPWMATLGFTPLSARLPSALAIFGTASLLWIYAARRGRPRAGWIAALIFLLSPLSLVLARQAIIDATLTFLLTLIVFYWAEAESAQKSLSRRLAYCGVAVAIGLSLLAKGLLALALPGGCLLVWCLLNRPSSPWRTIPWLPMAGIILLIAVPWHWLMYRATGWQFIEEYFLSNQVKRFAGQKWGHVQPVWFYVPILLVSMFPWSALVPVSLARSFRRDGEDELQPRLWALWAAVIFLFFSASKSKLPGYILPAIPPLALLVGSRLDQLWSSRSALSRLETALLAAVPLLLGGVGLSLGWMGQLWRGQTGVVWASRTLSHSVVETVTFFGPWALFVGVVFCAASGVLIATRHRIAVLFSSLAVLSVSLALVAVCGVLPYYAREQIQPLHTLARQALPGLERGEHLAIFNLRPRRPSLRYVLGHTSLVSEIEGDDPSRLRSVLLGKSGYILAMKAKPLPLNPVHATPVATSAKWMLYHWQR